ncbi:MAG: Holliday junction branch migration protein RuvA [Candidatus Competibacteraceae bacterium]|nr:Holliday junction branch migration protein RuvA [Candidatus Competibacteraceae bacterium]
MIGRLRGKIADKRPPFLLLDVHGVGYELEASLNTFQSLPETGGEITLHTHLQVREDAQTLYAFASTAERALFRSLIRISGIGPKLALLILSGMTVEAFGRCIQEGDARALARLPGIGKKTAERLIVEMGDRIHDLEPVGDRAPAAAGASPVSPAEDAVSALVALGYRLPEAEKMVKALDTRELSSETIIRQALQAAVRR